MIEPGDTVVRSLNPDGARGMVLYFKRPGWAIVCWQNGFDTESGIDVDDLVAVPLLEELVRALDGRETHYVASWPGSICHRCGRKVQMRKGDENGYAFCQSCNVTHPRMFY